MTKSKKFLFCSLLPMLVLILFSLNSISYAATTPPRPAVNQPGVRTVNPVVPKAANDGQIANVTTVPAGLWYTGTTVKIQWQWPGFVNFAADVTLWSGSQQVATIVSGWTNTSVGWNVPINFTPGTYTLRVQSSKNQSNRAEAAIRIENSTLSIISPKAGQTWTAGTTNQIVWTFQGKPGPLKIELIPASGGNALLIANNIAWGNLGAGNFNWPIPATINAGSYQMKISSTGNSLITASQTFSIQKLGTIGIIVTDTNNAPIDGAIVTTNINGAARSVNTSANGQAIFGMLPAGTYTFTATKQGFYPDGTNQTKVVLANGATQSAVIKMKRGRGKVVITVKDGTSPIQGMEVVVGTVGKYWLSALTKADGTATFDSFQTGTWPVTTQAWAYNRDHVYPHYVDASSAPGSGLPATPTYVTVNDGTTGTATISMQRFGWANVTVTDGTMPVYNADICKASPNGGVFCGVYKTDATGMVKMQLAPGIHTLQAILDGYKTSSFSVTVTSGGTTNQTVIMTKN